MKVIVIGAGASGLMAANILAKKGIEIILLEAENRIGGRIHTFVPPGFTNHIEAGAEFIHGDLPLTLQLMKKANLPYVPADGKMYKFKDGRMSKTFGTGKLWNEFYEILENVQDDCTVSELLEKHFSTKKYEALRNDVYEIAQGLDLADVSQLSVKSIKEEWLSEEMQFRPQNGYASLLEFLRNDAALENYKIILNQKVERISWKPGLVNVTTQNDEFIGDAIICTVPLGVYQRKDISFVPDIEGTIAQFDEIGFGQVIKMAFEFDNAFWNEKYPDMGYLFTEGGFTFWSQLSETRPVLMGWIGDGYVDEFENSSDEELGELALSALQDVFPDIDTLSDCKASAVFRYTKKSKFGGGYSWLTPKSYYAIKNINKGLENTLWFSGEAFHPSADVGTVEAALLSGRYTANKILKSLK